ncbi:carbohydrate sulfotransferase 11-like [Clytia hemisphaerica]|uniref:Carbohydrate sulfotransferase n=1 Tax=Clytia hemisphaerica TaxID=252671 RepID=A0A7M6DJS5_9CNID|eukprot:TCONS_00049392-protein
MLDHHGGGNSKLQRLFLVLLGGVIVLLALEGLSMVRSEARCTIQQVPVVIQQGDRREKVPREFDLPDTHSERRLKTTKTTRKTVPTTEAKTTAEPVTDENIATDTPAPVIDQNRQTQLQRQQHLKEFCQNNRRLRTEKFKIRDFHFIYSDKASALYCYIPKVACTNWKKVFQVMDGNYETPLDIKGKEKVHYLKFNTFEKTNLTEIEWRRNLYYSFLFIRHPFERVLSAYRNKFQDPYNEQYQRVYGSRVLRLFRKNLTEAEYKAGKNVTFREFADYVIRVHTKREFVNEHWDTMHNLCHPCRVKYDYIGSMDSLIEDSETVLKEIGWYNRVKFPAKATDKYKNKLPTLMKQYFSQLPRNVTMKLYKIYEADFKAFGYSADEYL